MEEYTTPKHSTEVVEFDEYAEKYAEKYDLPRWRVRRVAVSLSHSDVSTKIIRG